MNVCGECNAELPDDRTCAAYFHQALSWDFEDPAGAGSVHHLTVLCYHVQHPDLYSREGLEYAKGLMVEFLENGITPDTIRHGEAKNVRNSRRKWPITPRGSTSGTYRCPPKWTMTVKDVIAGGLECYPTSVKTWARSVFEALKESGNI
ncbi:MAG: DUF5946 family protein [Dehalogenimonas sp.]